MILPVPAPLSGLVGPAVVHGFVDFRRPWHTLWPYLLMLVPLPSPFTALMFGCASLVHFARDVGLAWSACLHAVILLSTGAGRADLATAMLLLYMNIVHVPRFIDDPVLITLSGIAFSFVRQIPLPSIVQRMVVAHVIVQGSSQHRNLA